MSDTFEHRVWSAAIAGWWVVLVSGVLLTASWIAYVVIIPAEPAWMLRLWGADLSWADIQRVWLWAVVVWKLTVWLMACVALWLTLWARQLRKANAR